MRVLIADDHPLYLDAVQEQIGRLFPGATIETAASLAETLANLKPEQNHDLVLIDYSMPGMNGRESVRTVVAKAGKAPVVIMSGIAIANEASEFISLGAKGFLPKTLNSKVFASVLNLVMAGGSYLPTEMFTSSAPTEEHPDSEFTEREQTIMQMLTEGKSNKEIARLLNLREVTIKVQLTHIYKKLGAKNRAQAATIMAQR